MANTPRQFRTQAIILKRRDFGESDRLLTVFTPHQGKLDVVAKGARKLNNPKTGHVELFTRVDLLIHSGRDLGLVSQAEMVNPYLGIREELMRGAYANHVVELLDRFTVEDDPDLTPALFELLGDTLEALCAAADPRLVARYYELRLLDAMGFRPELARCVINGEAIQPQDQFFSVELGGVVCPLCAHPRLKLLRASLDGLKVLRHLQRNRYDQISALQVSVSLHEQIERIMHSYLTTLLERKLKSVQFLQHIRRQPTESE